MSGLSDEAWRRAQVNLKDLVDHVHRLPLEADALKHYGLPALNCIDADLFALTLGVAKELHKGVQVVNHRLAELVGELTGLSTPIEP